MSSRLHRKHFRSSDPRIFSVTLPDGSVRLFYWPAAEAVPAAEQELEAAATQSEPEEAAGEEMTALDQIKALDRQMLRLVQEAENPEAAKKPQEVLLKNLAPDSVKSSGRQLDVAVDDLAHLFGPRVRINLHRLRFGRLCHGVRHGGFGVRLRRDRRLGRHVLLGRGRRRRGCLRLGHKEEPCHEGNHDYGGAGNGTLYPSGPA